MNTEQQLPEIKDEFRSIISHALLGYDLPVSKEDWELVFDECAKYAASLRTSQNELSGEKGLGYEQHNVDPSKLCHSLVLSEPMQQKMQKVLEIIDFTILEESQAKDPSEIQADAKLTDDLGMDSLDIASMLCQLQGKFDISIPTDQFDQFETVGDVRLHVSNTVLSKMPIEQDAQVSDTTKMPQGTEPSQPKPSTAPTQIEEEYQNAKKWARNYYKQCGLKELELAKAITCFLRGFKFTKGIMSIEQGTGSSEAGTERSKDAQSEIQTPVTQNTPPCSEQMQGEDTKQ